MRLPRQIADGAHLEEGTLIELEIVDGVIRMKPAKPRFTLTELLAGITRENHPDIEDDEPQSAELL